MNLPWRCRPLPAALLAAALLAAALLLTAAAAADDTSSTPVELTRATFGTASPAAAGEAVQLPHLWRNAGDAPVIARYRLQFDLRERPPDFAVRIAGTNLPFEARINGRHVHENGGPLSRPLPLSSWRAAPSFRIPVDLLEPGRNELELVVFANRRGLQAMGPVSVGSGAAISALELRGWLVHNMLPLVVASMLGVVGVIALALWRGRADRSTLFWLGIGTLLWALQDFVVQLPVRLLPQPHFSVLVIALYAWYPLALAIFFLRFGYQRSLLAERLAIGAMLLAAPVLYAAEALGFWDAASIGLRGIVMLFIFAALVAIVRFALRARDSNGVLLVAAGTVCAGSALWDYLASLVSVSLQPIYLTTYSGFALVLVAGWMLLDRYEQAFRAHRDLNLELEERIRAANAELNLRLAQTQAAREQAEQASIAKSRFFAAASHDLRQPLHSLGLFAATLDEQLASAPARESLRGIRESISALNGLFDELLDLSRLDAGIVNAQPRNVALQPLFDRLAREFHVEAVERELRLRFVPTRAVVRTDPLLLERILTNLVSNALRYTRQGGVVVGVRRRGSRAAIAVCDTGVGIAADKQPLVFEEFYQVSNPGRDRRLGLGLGLAIVQRLARLLDHPLRLRSVPGRGSCFCVELPRAAGPADPRRDEQPMIDDDALVGARVLIVDDDLMVREGTASLLQHWGVQASTAASGEEAARRIDGGLVPDVLIVDLRLGGEGDGIDVVEMLRRRLGRQSPALLISGDTGAKELLRVRRSGIPFLTKPVAPAKLRGMLRELVGSSGHCPPSART